MAYPKILAQNEKKFSYMRDLFQSPKVCLNLKGSQDHILVAIITQIKRSLEKENLGPSVTNMLWTQHLTSYKVNMNFPNLGPPCCMPRPKMMRDSQVLRGRPQYVLARGLLKKKKNNNKKKFKKRRQSFAKKKIFQKKKIL